MKLHQHIFKFSIFISTLCINTLASAQGWAPDVLYSQPQSETLKALQDPRFINLKNQVFKELENSWCSREKAQLIMDLVTLVKPNVSVEIGSFSGSTTLPLLKALLYAKQGHAYAIDAWSNSEAIANLDPNDEFTKWWGQVKMRKIKKIFQQMLKSHSLESVCTVLASPSQKVADKFTSIDFLILDGSFSEIGSALDAELYGTKVKPKGYILFCNAYLSVNNTCTKMKALMDLHEKCEVVCTVDNGNTILFQKE